MIRIGDSIASNEDFNTWVKALRSGKYKQTRGVLQDQDGYCCLGVACEVLIPDRTKEVYEMEGITPQYLLRGNMPGEQRFAPDWLDEVDGDFGDKTRHQLTELNDTLGFSFDEIADILEMVYKYRVLEE